MTQNERPGNWAQQTKSERQRSEASIKRTLRQSPSEIQHQRAIQVVLYARVASHVQGKEGFSIPAQLRLLRDYAASKGFAIAHEFTDVETAKESGRTNFGQMLAYLRKHPGLCCTILVEKTDRLYRNIKDYGTLDELDVEIHLVKENEVISRESRSYELSPTQHREAAPILDAGEPRGPAR